jgi:hypothetical protein
MDKFINIFYKKVKNREMALEKVPTPYREEVEKLLSEVK